MLQPSILTSSLDRLPSSNVSYVDKVIILVVKELISEVVELKKEIKRLKDNQNEPCSRPFV